MLSAKTPAFIPFFLIASCLQAAKHTAEICVYGDSPSAVSAAVQAARKGKDVILAAPFHHVGGILSNGLGSNDLDNHSFKNSVAVGGIAREYYERVAAKYGGGSGFRLEPHVSEEVFKDLLAEAGVRVRYGYRLSEEAGAVRMENGRIQSLRFENGEEIVAPLFIDGTVEGDLMAFAGVSFTHGREGNARYDETINGVITDTTYRQFRVPVDPYVIPGDPASGVITGIQDEPLGSNGDGDDKIMGFCFRMVLTRDPDNRIPVEKPEHYDEARWEIYLRYFAAGGESHFFYPRPNIPNGKTDVGSWHDLSANFYGENHRWPIASYAERQAIYDHHRTVTLGLIWFLQNDPRVPQRVRERWTGWGLPADEFTDNDNWPRMLYIRSGRRMLGDYVVTEKDLTKGNPEVHDPVCVAFWPPDMHHARRIVKDGKAYNEGFVFGGPVDWKPFGISYRAITPPRDECTNLLVPSALSSSYVAYGSIRLEWTFMALGQSAGTAAALALEEGVPVQKVDYEKLRDALLQDGQILKL